MPLCFPQPLIQKQVSINNLLHGKAERLIFVNKQNEGMMSGSIMHRIAVWRSGDWGSLFSLCHWLKTVDLKEFTHSSPFASISSFRWGSEIHLIWQKAELKSRGALSSRHVLRLILLLGAKAHKVAPRGRGYYVHQHSYIFRVAWCAISYIT